MPEFALDLGSSEAARSFGNLDSFTQGYIEAMFFTSTGSGDDGELEDATVAELSDEALAKIKGDCDTFKKSIRKTWHKMLLEFPEWHRGETECGHDFWYTRNGHGVGFWESDRWPGGYGNAFDLAAKSFREVDLYRGDDGLLYLS